MKQGRNKIIFIILGIVLVLVLLIGGIFAYTTTDLLKSNQTLFFKYLGKTLENLKGEENATIAQIQQLKGEMPYTVEGNLSIETDGLGENTDILNAMKMKVESKVNKQEEETYTKASLLYKEQDLFTLEYAKSNAIYALKSDEIVTAFLGIEEENVNVLLQKLGVENTSALPNKIQPIDAKEFFSITEEEKQHICNTYYATFLQNVSEDKFSKDRDATIRKAGVMYHATAYRLMLNAEELKNLEIKLLEELQQDSITLNFLTAKAKLLGLGEQYTQVNNLTKEIQKEINQIQQETYPSEEGISITIYVDKGKVITTEILLRNERKYTLYGEKQEDSITRYLLIENLSTTAEYGRIEIQQTQSQKDAEVTNHVLLNIDEKMTIEINGNENGSLGEQFLDTNWEVTFTQEETSNTIRYEQEINFVEELEDMLKVDRTNCAILNDYTTDQIQSLMQSIIQRIVVVLEQKKQIVGWQE